MPELPEVETIKSQLSKYLPYKIKKVERSPESKSIIKKEEYSKFSLKSLVSGYFEGSMNNLVSFLVKENDVNLNELTELLNDLDKTDKSK